MVLQTLGSNHPRPSATQTTTQERLFTLRERREDLTVTRTPFSVLRVASRRRESERSLLEGLRRVRNRKDSDISCYVGQREKGIYLWHYDIRYGRFALSLLLLFNHTMLWRSCPPHPHFTDGKRAHISLQLSGKPRLVSTIVNSIKFCGVLPLNEELRFHWMQ